MSWQPVLILLCTHLGIYALGCWQGQKDLKRYKRKLFGGLYSGTHFRNPHRRILRR